MERKKKKPEEGGHQIEKNLSIATLCVCMCVCTAKKAAAKSQAATNATPSQKPASHSGVVW